MAINFKRIFETARPLERFWVAPDDKGILRGYFTQDKLTCRNVNDNHREDSLYEVAIPSEVLVKNCKPNLYEFGMMKAIQAGIDVKHCAVCDKYSRCILNFNEEVEDKKTNKKRIVPRQILMRQIPDNKIDKVALAGGCKNYAHNRFFVYSVLNNYRVLPNWEWKNDMRPSSNELL